MARSMISNNDDENTKDDESNRSFDDEGDEGRDQVKKGPWTPEEDMILMEYVQKNGEGNWNSVQKNSGLSRCGKSCRLRWANHLRPNLKKGAFSEDEENVIVELHAKLGNKWARMASQLPGRTDNEIKNFWNTRLKRRQRAGLPIYPPEAHAEAHAFKYQIEQCKLKNPSSSPSFSQLLKSCYKNHQHPLQNNPDSANCTHNPGNPYPQLNSMPLSPISPYPSSSSSTLFNQNFAPYNNNSRNMTMNYDHGFGSVYEPAPLVPDSITEISSNDTPHDSATPDSSYVSPIDGLMGASSAMVNNDYYEVAPPLSSEGSNTGLLDDLVMEARNLSRNNDMSKSENSTSSGKVSHKRKSMEAAEEEHVEEPVEVPAMKKSSGDKANETVEDFNSGKKAIEEDPWAEMNFEMDDDLFSLINDFPSGMPMPEWYRSGESDPLGLETQNDAANPSGSGPTNQELAWTLGNCWNNMPGIC